MLTAQTPTIESAAKESASAEKKTIGGRSVTRAAIARKPEGIWTTGDHLEGDYRQWTIGQVNASYTAIVFIWFKKCLSRKSMSILAEVQATSWRLRECIQARELAATHRRGSMRRLRVLEEQEAWNREAGFHVSR